MAIKYYRPSFTALELTYLLHMVKCHRSDYEGVPSYNSALTVAAVKKLSALISKIDNDAISPAFSTAPKESLSDKLGMDAIPSTTSMTYDKPVDKITRNLAAYNMYMNKDIECTLSVIAEAKEHMYVNDLMTPEEEAAYEADTHS